MNYIDWKNKVHAEVSALPIKWAFNGVQFAAAMHELGLTTKDTDKLYGIPGGGFYRKEDHELIKGTMVRHNKELEDLLKEDDFLYDAIQYELDNHEYIVTGDTTDALEALNITKNDPRVEKILNEIRGQY